MKRKTDILDTLCIAIDQNSKDKLNILKLLKTVRTPFQAQDMVETIVNMHAHDKFHNSNKDLVGLMWTTTLKKSQLDEDEVVM